MYLEEHTVKDQPQLKVGHPFHWLEKEIKGAHSGLNLHKKDLHDAEHERQLIHWKCNPKHTSKLTIRKDNDGNFFADRLYHIMLHLRFWKETNAEGPRAEVWKRFEAESGFNLDELTLPNPAAAGESAY